MNTTFSLGSGVGTTCPRAGSRCEISPVKNLASLNFSTSSSVMEEGIHRPRRSEPNIVEGPKHLKSRALGVGTRGKGRNRLRLKERSRALVSL